MDVDFRHIATDTRYALDKQYRAKALLKGIWTIESPIFDRLAAERFARPE